MLSYTLVTSLSNKEHSVMTSTTQSNLNYLVPFAVTYYKEGMEERVPASHRCSILWFKTPQKEVGNSSYVRTPTLCVALPAISITVTPTSLQDAMVAALEEMQDSAVRSFITRSTEGSSGVGLSTLVVPQELGTASGVAAASLAKAPSLRLTKEGIEKWFTSEIEVQLVELVASKLPASSPPEVAVAQAQKAKVALSSLAGSRTVMPQVVAIALQKALSLAPEGNRMKVQLMGKLEVFANPPSSEELLSML